MSKDIEALIERLEKGETGNALDIAIDIALFEPDQDHVAVKANNAGTKLVYTRAHGGTDTFWARDHTLNDRRVSLAIASLKSLLNQEESRSEESKNG